MVNTKSKIRKKSILIGVIGSLILLTLYFGILTIANSFDHAIQQFIEMWYWILFLVIGFGIQLGLYSYIRTSIHTKMASATAEVATTGGISTGSMIACCAHHLTDVLPIVGLSAAAVFLTKYQLLFIILGILSNLVGVTMMLNIIQKHGLFDDKGFFKEIFRYDMKGIRNKTILISLILFSVALVSINRSSSSIRLTPGNPDINRVIYLPTKTNDENGVSFDIKPIDFSYDKPVMFEVGINTHSGSLDFELIKVSILEDDKGNEYLPLSWEGSPPGGHHRSGILTFPKLKNKVEYIKLIIKDVYDVPERNFIWNLER